MIYYTKKALLPPSHGPKGNISLIMIFVLAIGSIIGLMSTNFLNNMIRETTLLKTSYQTYYLAKAGIELGNLAVNRYDYGFHDYINTGSSIFTNNLNCANNCTIEVAIRSLITGNVLIGKDSSPISNCTPNNALWLNSGASQIIPLFIDTRKLSTANNNPPINIISNYNLNLNTANNMAGAEVGVAIVLSTGNQIIYDQQDTSGMQKLYITGNAQSLDISNALLDHTNNINNAGPVAQTISQLLQSRNPYNYLVITNIGSNPFGLCLHFTPNNYGGYPLESSTVTSKAQYLNSTLSLQSITKKILPDYVYNSYQGD